MEIIVLLLKQNLVMFVYLVIGYFLYKKKLVSVQGSADIGRILLYIIMPAAILKSYLAEFSMERLEGLAVSFLAALLSLLLAIAAARIAFRREQGIERFGAAFSNAGFIGIPLVQMTLGEEAVFYVSSFVALLNILQWTYGLVTITGDRSLISVQRLKTNPIILSFLAGIALFFLPVSLPDTIENVVGTIAASAPVGSNVAIFAQLYQQDYMQAVKEVCLSTLLCIISLPLILGIANYIL